MSYHSKLPRLNNSENLRCKVGVEALLVVIICIGLYSDVLVTCKVKWYHYFRYIPFKLPKI